MPEETTDRSVAAEASTREVEEQKSSFIAEAIQREAPVRAAYIHANEEQDVAEDVHIPAVEKAIVKDVPTADTDIASGSDPEPAIFEQPQPIPVYVEQPAPEPEVVEPQIDEAVSPHQPEVIPIEVKEVPKEVVASVEPIKSEPTVNAEVSVEPEIPVVNVAEATPEAVDEETNIEVVEPETSLDVQPPVTLETPIVHEAPETPQVETPVEVQTLESFEHFVADLHTMEVADEKLEPLHEAVDKITELTMQLQEAELLDGEKTVEKIEQELIETFMTVFELADIKISEEQVKNIVSLWIKHDVLSKQMFDTARSELFNDLGTHEALQKFMLGIAWLKDLLETLHTKIGRIAMAEAHQPASA